MAKITPKDVVRKLGYGKSAQARAKFLSVYGSLPIHANSEFFFKVLDQDRKLRVSKRTGEVTMWTPKYLLKDAPENYTKEQTTDILFQLKDGFNVKPY